MTDLYEACQALREELTKYYREEVEPLKRENEALKKKVAELEYTSVRYRDMAAKLKRERDRARNELEVARSGYGGNNIWTNSK